MAESSVATGTFYISIAVVLLLLFPFVYKRKRKPTLAQEQQQLAQTESHWLVAGGYADSIARPPQAHAGGRNPIPPPPVPVVVIDEAEQLPRYEAPPPEYERIVKAGEQQSVEMRDLERGESSRAAAGDSAPLPGYQAAVGDGGGDEGGSTRRAENGGIRAREPPPPPPGALFVRRALSMFRPFSRRYG